ncbi:MAG: hypothetical protein OK436_03135 [Thaumarchaeota archaeon]|nr:hypothetical protein [Nitrososphaerota archaeon]
MDSNVRQTQISFLLINGVLQVKVTGNFTVADMIFALDTYKHNLLMGKLQGNQAMSPRVDLGNR